MNTPPLTLGNRPLTARDIRTVAISSMEQIIGTALSCVVGIIIPLIQLLGHPELSAFTQGLIGASGLIGIATGSAIIGRLIDRQGYLTWFRLCPLIITAGAVWVWLCPSLPCIIAGLFIVGFGVGGGYTLDSAYISEILPDKWRLMMVGVAKASCALGFILPALISWFIIKADPHADIWPRLMLIVAAFGLLTFLLRLRWRNSPQWLADHGQQTKAQEAAQFFVGRPVKVPAKTTTKNLSSSESASSLWKGKNLLKIIYSGLPWACEGLGVYGFGVFLPILIMALGIETETATGIPRILNSVQMTFWINVAILPGFIIGLCVVNRLNHANMMGFGFLGSALGLLILLGGYLCHWPLWVSVVGFVLFEVTLNAGPHLVTFIIPAQIFPVANRGAGTGVASMLGKVGAVLGVFLMPIWIKSLGMTGVLLISVGVMLAGALITWIVGRLLKLV